MSGKRLRVAVCGGGIGGLTCAIALQKYPDIQVDVYEAAAQFAEIGAGVGVWPRPWRILESLGLSHDLLKATDLRPTRGSVPIFNWRKSDQSNGFHFYTLYADGSLLTFSRPDFQKTLIRHVTCRKHCAKRLQSYRQSPAAVELLFEDGTTAICDVLIGADGIKSAVRRCMLKQQAQQARRVSDAEEIFSGIEPVWCGAIAYRAVVPAEKLRAAAPDHPALKSPNQYMGKDAHIVAYPIANGKMVNVAAFICRHDLEGAPFTGQWVTTTGSDEFMGQFANWELEVRLLIGCIDTAMKWAIHTVKPLRSFVSGRVALIGDAAHAEQPTQGAGAGQAIEDAFFLATLLGHPRTTSQTLLRTLSVYDCIRRPFSADVAERSRRNAQCFSMYHQTVADLHRYSDQEAMHRLLQMAEVVRKNWQWVWSTTLDSSLEEALLMLESNSR